MKTTDIIATKEGIISRAKELRNESASWTHQWQIVCVSAALHVQEHGDYRILKHILKIGKQVNVNAMKEFFKVNAPVDFKNDGSDITIVYLADKRLNLAEMAAQPVTHPDHVSYKEYMTTLLTVSWETYKAPPKINPVDLQKALDTLAKRARKQITDKIEGTHIDSMTLAAVEMLAATGRIDIATVADQMGFALVRKDTLQDVALAS